MQPVIIFIYSILAYLFGLGTLVYLLLFIGPWDLLPSHIDDPARSAPLYAAGIDMVLILLFALQHSIMARSRFKQWLLRWLPAPAERSSYVLVSGLLVLALLVFWQPLPAPVWHLQQPLAAGLLCALYVAGWTLAVIASFIINHFELFGLQQGWLHLRRQAEPARRFSERSFYRLVRHPIQLGTLIGLWATPTMSVGHLLLASGLSLYTFIGLYFEEKDLLLTLGRDYADYRQRVPKILPLGRRNTKHM